MAVLPAGGGFGAGGGGFVDVGSPAGGFVVDDELPPPCMICSIVWMLTVSPFQNS